jgi:hypothetical protein
LIFAKFRNDEVSYIKETAFFKSMIWTANIFRVVGDIISINVFLSDTE